MGSKELDGHALARGEEDEAFAVRQQRRDQLVAFVEVERDDARGTDGIELGQAAPLDDAVTGDHDDELALGVLFLEGTDRQEALDAFVLLEVDQTGDVLAF